MTREQDDLFQYWLMDMGDAIERFREALPSDVAASLDFSPESLAAIEAFILATYAGIEEIKKPSEAQGVDGMARYVGEVFRRHLGGKWTIDLSDKKNAFYGLPQLTGMKGQITPICPLTLVTASTSRRTGTFISMVFNNNRQLAAKSLK